MEHRRPDLRAGRFSRVADLGQDRVQPLTFPQLLAVDIASKSTLSDARIAQDRVRTLAHSAAFLLISHLVSATLILLTTFGTTRDTMQTLWIALGLTALVALDIGFWAATRRQRKR